MAVKKKMKTTRKTMKDSAKIKGAGDTITKDSIISEVVRKHPDTIEVFIKHGLHCFGCGVAAIETVEMGASAHGIKTEPLVRDLNAAANKSKSVKK